MRRRLRKPLSLALTMIVLFSSVSAALTMLAFGAQQLVVTVQVEKPWYLQGERVHIFGKVTNITNYPIGTATVAMEVKDSRGNTIFLDVVYTGTDGNYQDSFRLSSSARIGLYTIYVTASKTGYLTAANHTNFSVTNEQLGRTTISIAGHSFTLQTNNQVKGQLNITTLSESQNWIVTSNRLMATDPTGTKVYDNFLGIGGPQDYRLATIYNNTITTLNFQFTLLAPKSGYYTYMFTVDDASAVTTYASTAWISGFLYTPPPIFTMNLGSLAPDSTISSSLTLDLRRFESARFTFALTQPIKSLTLSLGATNPSKFQVSLNITDQVIQNELQMIYTWEISNLPAGTYDIKPAALSDTAPLTSISLQSGTAITSPIVSITNVEETSASATPGGTMNYHVCVEWSISADDVLNVSASFEGTLSDSEESQVSVLDSNHEDFYLTVNAPQSGGTYSVVLRATLKQANIFTDYSTSLEVRSGTYNITVLNDVQYYRMPSCWEWLNGARTPDYYKNPSKLSALDVTDIQVIDVGTDLDDNPVNVTIEFRARNKAGSWLSFGGGPHYDLWIEDMHDLPPFQIGLLIAGEPNEAFRAVLKVDSNRKVDFKIRFRISVTAESILLAEGVFETLVSTYVSGWTGDAAQFFGDIVKLIALNYLKTCTETERGYMVKNDIPTFIESLHQTSELTSDLIKLADGIFRKNGRNPWLAVLNAVWDAYINQRIDPLEFVNAGLRLLLWFCYRSAGNCYKIMEKALEKTGLVYERTVSSLATSWSSARADWFIKKLGIVFSIVKLLKVVWDLWTMPPEEGKVVGTTLDTDSAIEPFDPLISVSYYGPTANTTLDYFGDVYSLSVNTTLIDATNATGEIHYTVDPNMTSTYLSIISHPTFQRNMFTSFGLNATSTDLEWQEGSNSFWLRSDGSMYSGLRKTSISLNNTWIQGYSEMSGDAIQTGNTAWFNSSLIYPFGKNLTCCTTVSLPSDFAILQIHSDGEYTLQDNVITWNIPIDWLAIEFVSPHDIAISNVEASKTVSSQNQTLSLNATVHNQGNVTETFNMLAYANATLIQNQTLTLEKESSFPIAFTWNTTGFARGKYILTFFVTALQDEIDTADNTITDGAIVVTILGDINGDEKVDSLDLSQLGNAYGSVAIDTNWDSNADMNNDAIISVRDLWILGKNYGKTDP